MHFTPGTRFGPYEICAALGAGGMGEVYRARDTRLGREVALKVLLGGRGSEQEARRFLQEAVVLARLSHPNIATLYEFDHANSVDFLILELVLGETLSARIARGALPEPEAVTIAKQVAAALEHAHASGIVHQDLKPGNLILTARGKIKVLDFGVARVFSWAADAATLMATNRGAGTVPYMAPEQLRGEETTAQTDLYGLGVVLYEMLTGQLPFAGTTAAMVSNAILHSPAPPPSQRVSRISAALDQIVLQCLAKDAATRFPSAAALRQALRQAHGDGSGSGRSETRPTHAPEPARRSLVALPAQVLGAEADRYLGDAIASTLSTCLGEAAEFQVRMSPRQVDVERVEGGLSAVMQAYAVDLFLLASVIPQEATLAVNLQVVEKATQQVLWSKELEAGRGVLLPTLREAARAIAGQLGRERTPTASAPARLASTGGELPFQNAVYRANLYMHRGNTADFQLARESLLPLAEAGSHTAEACAALARLYASALQKGLAAAEAVPMVRHWSERALSIDPRSARAWAALSAAESMQTAGFGRQLEYALRAASLAPQDPVAYLALSSALAHSSHAFTLAACRHVSDLDPLDVNAAVHEGTLQAMLGHKAEALSRIEHALALGPDFPHPVMAKAAILCMVGEYAAAGTWVEERLRPLAQQNRAPADWVQLFTAIVALGTAADGAHSDCAAACDFVVSCATGARPFNHWQILTQHVAAILVHTGHAAAALEVLEARAATGLLDPYDFFLLQRHFEPLRPQARFQAVAARSRGSFLGMLAALGRARTEGEFPACLAEPWSRYAGLVELYGEAPTEAPQ